MRWVDHAIPHVAMLFRSFAVQITLGVIRPVRYIATTRAIDFKAPSRTARSVRRLLWFIPSASPDHEALYSKVRRWLLEVDDSGAPQREVGLAEDGNPLIAAPDGRNFGFWTDSPYRFHSSEGEAIDAAYFETLWRLALVARQ